MTAPDFISIVVSREDVRARNTAPTLEWLRSLIASPEAARSWYERVNVAFEGYDQTHEELPEIAEVRTFVQDLDEQFPYWLYFCSKRLSGLQCIAYCFLPPSLTPAAQAELFPGRLSDLLTKRWFPAMNQICQWVGMSEQEIETLSDRSAQYLLHGPIRE